MDKNTLFIVVVIDLILQKVELKHFFFILILCIVVYESQQIFVNLCSDPVSVVWPATFCLPNLPGKISISEKLKTI